MAPKQNVTTKKKVKRTRQGMTARGGVVLALHFLPVDYSGSQFPPVPKLCTPIQIRSAPLTKLLGDFKERSQ